MQNENLKQIVKQWLLRNGYDGLVNPGICCGCSKDDLMPCGNPNCNCQAGYEVAKRPESCPQKKGDCFSTEKNYKCKSSWGCTV